MNDPVANPPRVVVIRGGAIGDFMLTLPVLAALRRQFPLCRLEVIGYPHIAQLALEGGLVDAVRGIEARPLATFFARHGPLDPEWSRYFAETALIISYLYDPDTVFEDNVKGCGKAQFVAGPHRPDELRGLHATAAFLEPLQRLAIFDADPVPRLDLVTASGVELRSWVPFRVALHPGSGSETKNWPEACWEELISCVLEETRLDLLLVGGEAEGQRLERLMAVHNSSRVHLARSLPLGELARELARCRAFVGHDSGITHLAAAVQLPGLALWGSTRESVWRPNSDRVVLLRAGDGLAHLSVSTVLGALRDLLAQDFQPA